MSALLISKKLGLKPQTVYRAVAPLLRRGIITTLTLTNSQPRFYKCLPYAQARRRYAEYAASEYETWFGPLVPVTVMVESVGPDHELPEL